MVKIAKQDHLEQIAADIVENNVCPDLAQSANKLVMGSGNLDADIVFIGEAPGKREDLTGQPFVGASGKFLDKMLESINLLRADVYITNIVKYRPPNNRDPSNEEKASFLPYLISQLEIIAPKVVIPLGRHSMNVFLPEAIISEVHGQVFKGNLVYPKAMIMPLYHPAAALYNGGLRQTLLDDFSNILQIINK